MAKMHRWLHEELDGWQADGLVDNAQAEAIRQRYPLGPSTDWGRLALSAIGAVIIGLGVILFFAYNWADMPRLVKLGVIVAGLIVTHGGGWWAARQGRSEATVEAAHLLGTTLFGAGIWLVSQAYHIDPITPDPFLVWGLGALAAAWALPSRPQALIALGLLITWTVHDVDWSPTSFNLVPSAVLAFGVLPLVILQRSKPLIWLTSAALFVLVPFGLAPLVEDVAALWVLGQALVMLGLAALGKHLGWSELSPIASIGYLVYVPLLFVLTFPRAALELAGDPTDPGVVLLIVCIACGLLGFAAWKTPRRVEGITYGIAGSVMALFAAYPFDLVSMSDGWLVSLPFNLALAAHAVVFILEGGSRRSWQHISAGCLMLFVLASARFVDIFDSLLMRSLAFVLFGLALVAVGRFVHRQEIRSEADHA